MSLAEEIGENREKEVQKLMEKGYSRDFSLLLWGFDFYQTSIRLGIFHSKTFLSFFVDQSNMLREKDPERADSLDKDLLLYLEKNLTNKV